MVHVQRDFVRGSGNKHKYILDESSRKSGGEDNFIMESLEYYGSTDGNILQTLDDGVCSPPCGNYYTLH